MASVPNTTVAGVLLVARQLPITTVLAEHVSLVLETDMGSRWLASEEPLDTAVPTAPALECRLFSLTHRSLPLVTLDREGLGRDTAGKVYRPNRLLKLFP